MADTNTKFRTTPENLSKLGIKQHGVAKAVRAKCIECQGGLGEGAYSAVQECGSTMCALWPFRSGKNPWRSDKLKDKEGPPQV